jgi:hypothetical protein
MTAGIMVRFGLCAWGCFRAESSSSFTPCDHFIVTSSRCERQMQENNVVFVTSSPEDPIRSDLHRVDAHVIQPEEYEEIPEITDAELVHAVIRIPGQPDEPVVVDPSQTA